MNHRQQLIQELEQAPDDLIETVLDFLRQQSSSGQVFRHFKRFRGTRTTTSH